MSGGLRYNKGKTVLHLLPLEYFSDIEIIPGKNIARRISYMLVNWYMDDGSTRCLKQVLNMLEDECGIGAVEIAKVLNAGSEKYEPRNWEKGMSWTVCYDCALRHLNKMHLESLTADDDDSGLPHAAHAACNVLFLLTYMHRFPELDDRPKLEVKDDI